MKNNKLALLLCSGLSIAPHCVSTALAVDLQPTSQAHLSIERQAAATNDITVRWQGDYELEESSSLTRREAWWPSSRPYLHLRDGSLQVRLPGRAPQRFFRVRPPSPLLNETNALTLLRQLVGTNEYVPNIRPVSTNMIKQSSVQRLADLVNTAHARATNVARTPHQAPSSNWHDVRSYFCYGNKCLDLPLLAANIEAALDGKVTKYGYRIRSDLAVLEKAKGPKRTTADPPASDFTVDDRFNPASVTKVITAVALLRALEQNGISVDASIISYVPFYWKADASIQNITFRQVLNHTSGFRDSDAGDQLDFAHIQQLIEKGVNEANKVPKYQNINYAVARVLLCYADGYFLNWGVEDGLGTSLYFADFVNQEILNPIGINNVTFTPEANGTLFYPFPAGTFKGTDFGDYKLLAGSAGIQLSIYELSEFLRWMWVPEFFLSGSMLDELRQSGLGVGDYGSFADGTAYGKSGDLTWVDNNGTVWAENSTIIHFACGVDVVLVLNGPGSAKTTVLDAYQAAWKTKL